MESAETLTKRPLRIGLEIGGTFTDVIWSDACGELGTAKVWSRPDAIHEAIAEALDHTPSDLRDVDVFVHGSTVATNALLERKGAVVALLTTAGFRDLIEIGTHDRVGDPYDIFYRKPPVLVPRRLVAEVEERMTASGEVDKPLELEGALDTIDRLVESGVTSVAISFLNSYVNPTHELALMAAICKRYPGIPVTASSSVSREFREFPRTMTTVVNALVRPPVADYLSDLERALEIRKFNGDLQIVQSTGSVIDAPSACHLPVRLLLSGPSAGVRAALYFAGRNGISDVITFDMGGTSTDVSIADGLKPRMVGEISVGEIPVRVPAIDIVTLGAGGGSIASINADGLLTVGPESAGAYPGPACFGRGGKRPTVTDAQVIAGLIRGDRNFGGTLQIDRAEAHNVIAGLGLSGSPMETAEAILGVAVSRMASAVRLVSTARGVNPTDYTLVSYGGGGPVHAASVADEVGIQRVLVPWKPGIASAFGLLISDFAVEMVRGIMKLLDDETLGQLALDELLGEAARIAAHHRLNEASTEVGLDLRYAGQAYEITTWFGPRQVPASTIAETFHATHAERYGYRRVDFPILVVNRRLSVRQPTPHTAHPPPPPAPGKATAIIREIRMGGTLLRARFFNRDAMSAGMIVEGPLVLEEATTTTVVPPGWRASILSTGDLLMERIQ